MNRLIKVLFAAGLCIFLLHAGFSRAVSGQAGAEGLKDSLGAQDAVLLTDEAGRTVFGHNTKKQMVPASTLKILTAAAAMHYLGPDYRFPTEFYLDAENNLVIKGYGDPVLVSEEVRKISLALKARGVDTLRNIAADGSYFDAPVHIPGITGDLSQPYNAPNGALCVNFNTVKFSSEDGRIKSAEPQTPMLPAAMNRIRESGQKSGRIVLSRRQEDLQLYAGELFMHFMKNAGIEVKGSVQKGPAGFKDARLVYRHESSLKLTEIVESLFEHSSNFIANQLLLAAGAYVHGPPATLEKGLKAVSSYSRSRLCIKKLRVEEGSGISRKNRISPEAFDRILEEFEPYRELMPEDKGTYYKTGTLDGIRTMAGYIESPGKEVYRFVIFLNSGRNDIQAVLHSLIELLP